MSSGMKGLAGLACVLLAAAVGLGLSLAVFVLPRNVSAGFAFCAFLFLSAAALWYVRSVVIERRRGRVDGLANVGQRRPRLSLYDTKTGLCADWYFKLRLQEEITRASRYGTPFGLMLVSVAKPDDPGARDRVVAAMSQTFRDTDLVGHVDTDARFGVLLVNTDAESSELARMRLQAQLRDGDASVTLACCPSDGTDWRELLKRAGASPAEFYGLTGGEALDESAITTGDGVSIDAVRAALRESARYAA
jgi:GGDEF domain-containing protein